MSASTIGISSRFVTVAMRLMMLVLCLALVVPATAQAPGAGERELRDRLQRVYRAWAGAMRDRNLDAWQSSSTQALQNEVRNQIVSQKLPYPRALFESPLMAPQVSRLRFVRARQVGDEAQLVYFGRFDAGLIEEGKRPPENLLVIWFGREQGGWAVGRIQMLDLDPMPEVRAKMRRFDYSFLDEPGFVVDGVLPKVAKLAPRPDFIGKVFAISFNESTEVMINGVSDHSFGATRAAQLVLGGFKRGENTVSVKVSPLAEGQEPADTLDDNAPYVIRLYLMPDDPSKQFPVIVWRYESEDGTAPSEPIEATFVIDDKVIEQRYRRPDSAR
ncbi:hypothetical protein [Sulfuriroseicoccus oceanibius]|uniref:Uncharacterized protein n=1 Tax=Sulfuriroseicoccus oceanibius TaxID=2707525 RepID=A0A6B3L8L0_9BACT|nr:hypothetical protein [Sulfuriroseicoccus oceanibius]QQL46255.1 hypothetical protein G3M56_006670 [Sulfuriroseicoccus oceanibius]